MRSRHPRLPARAAGGNDQDLSDPSTQLVFLGDYVDRGPDAASVLAAVKRLCDAHLDQVIALAGNHEVWFLD